MKHVITPSPAITIRPATIFAFIKVLPLLLIAILFLYSAVRFLPALIWLSLVSTAFAVYRYYYIRSTVYEITPEVIRFSRGIFFRRVDTIELYRVKDYILTQSFILQIFNLMDLTLKTTDRENPVVWLRGIPVSNLVDIIRDNVQLARQHNRIYEIN